MKSNIKRILKNVSRVIRKWQREANNNETTYCTEPAYSYKTINPWKYTHITKDRHFTSLHFTSLHFTSLHFTSLHFASLHFSFLHLTSLHFTTLLSPFFHFPPLLDVSSFFLFFYYWIFKIFWNGVVIPFYKLSGISLFLRQNDKVFAVNWLLSHSTLRRLSQYTNYQLQCLYVFIFKYILLKYMIKLNFCYSSI